MESLRFRHSESNRDTEEILRDDRGATSMYEEIHEEARWWIEHSMLFIPLDDFGCRRHDIFFCSLFTTWVVSCTDINKMGRLYKNPGWSWLEECTRADNGKGYKAKQNTSVLFKILLKYWLEENTRLSALQQNQTLPIICQWFCSSPKWYGPRAAAYVEIGNRGIYVIISIRGARLVSLSLPPVDPHEAFSCLRVAKYTNLKCRKIYMNRFKCRLWSVDI